jgi:hypothetical protein
MASSKNKETSIIVAGFIAVVVLILPVIQLCSWTIHYFVEAPAYQLKYVEQRADHPYFKDYIHLAYIDKKITVWEYGQVVDMAVEYEWEQQREKLKTKLEQ